MDGAEAGGGEGREHPRVGGDSFGGAFAAAESGGDELVGVAAVGLGAGRAAGGAAVVAADQEVPGGQIRGVEFAEDFAGGGVDVGALSVEADGVVQPPRPRSWRMRPGMVPRLARNARSPTGGGAVVVVTVESSSQKAEAGTPGRKGARCPGGGVSGG